MTKNNYCRICGFYYENYYPWGESCDSPTYDICVCCGAEFGFDDISEYSAREYRSEWLKKGAKFFHPASCPENWDISEQLKNIPKDYL